MKFKFLSFILVMAMFLISVNVSHASERGSPKCGIEKQDVTHVVSLEAIHSETINFSSPIFVPDETVFIRSVSDNTEKVITSIYDPPDFNEIIARYNRRC